VLTVIGRQSKEEKSIAPPYKVPLGTSSWQIWFQLYDCEFNIAVRIGFDEKVVHSQSCPIFGTLWLDDFSLNKDQEKIQG